MELSIRDRDLLDFERNWITLDLAKDVALSDRFGLTPEQYHEVLIDLIDRPEALAHDPLVVRRLQRARDRRREGRLDESGRDTR